MACQKMLLWGPRVEKISSDQTWFPHTHTHTVRHSGEMTSERWTDPELVSHLIFIRPPRPDPESPRPATQHFLWPHQWLLRPRSLRWTHTVWHDGFGTVGSWAHWADCQAKYPKSREEVQDRKDDRWREGGAGDQGMESKTEFLLVLCQIKSPLSAEGFTGAETLK